MENCIHCERPDAVFNMRQSRHGRICNNCYDAAGVNCQACGIPYLENDDEIDFRLRGSRGVWICNLCNDSYVHRQQILSRSQQTLTTPQGGQRRMTNIPHRSYQSVVVGSGHGDIVQSARGWSTEIECYITNAQELHEGFRKLPDTFGINRDGSLRHVGDDTSDGRILVQGIEITTPILKGKSGEKYLKDLCDTINKNDNARVDATCGLHIHIDMSDQRTNYTTLKNILVFHWIYENVLMSFLPSTRRANQYCQSLRNKYSVKSILATNDYYQLRELWYKNREVSSRYDKKHTRYHGINMHSLFADGHIEVRYHSGTTNPHKILHWAALHTKIIDICSGIIEKEIDPNGLVKKSMTPLGRSRSISLLTKNFFETLNLSPETKEYFMKRQKKFLHAPEALEVEFVEKDDPKIYEGKKPENKSKSFRGFNYGNSVPATGFTREHAEQINTIISREWISSTGD